MTERTENFDWICFALALLAGPPIALAAIQIISLLFPPFALIVMIFTYASLCIGYASYLIIAGPLMAVIHLLGLDHPIFHAAIGLGAVLLIPAAHAAGIPFVASPEAAEMGLWLGPIWCAASAYIYNILRNFRADVAELA